jgi:hypothetical protein
MTCSPSLTSLGAVFRTDRLLSFPLGQGFQERQHSLGIVTGQRKPRHRRPGRAACSGDTGGHQPDELLIGAGRQSREARGDIGPFRNRHRGSIDDRSAKQPARPIGLAALVARRVTLPAGGYVLDEVLSARHLSAVGRSRASDEGHWRRGDDQRDQEGGPSHGHETNITVVRTDLRSFQRDQWLLPERTAGLKPSF